MPRPLQEFYSFPVYENREDYEAKTGKPAPPWNPRKPLKLWADPNPTETEFDEQLGEFATYRPVLSRLPNGVIRSGQDGQPVVSTMRLNVEDAKSYNFLPTRNRVPVFGEELNGTLITADFIANASRKIEPPLTLPAGSRVIFSAGLGYQSPVVLMPGETLAGSASGFTDADRALLQRIAQALKVS